MKVTKEQAKALFDFVNENHNKPRHIILNPVEGLEIKLEYIYWMNPAWDMEVTVEDVTVKLSKELKTLQKCLSANFSEHITDDADRFLSSKEFNLLSKQFNKLRSVFPHDFLREMNDISVYNKFEDFWKAVEEYIQELTTPSTSKIKLNGSYDAIIKRGKTTIAVGCQSIPIDRIRTLLVEFDKINA